MIIITICFMIFILALDWRAEYSYKIMQKANDVILHHVFYNRDLKPEDAYLLDNITIGYYKYTFCFWKFGVISCFKPEYKEKIKYIMEEDKHIKSRRF